MKEERVISWIFAALLWLIVAVVAIIGYLAIFTHRDCVTKDECKQIVDSVLTEIYD